MEFPMPVLLVIPTDIVAGFMLLTVTLQTIGFWWHRLQRQRHRASGHTSWRWLRSVPWGATLGVVVALLADVFTLTTMLSDPTQGILLIFLAVAVLAVYTGIFRGIRNLEQQEDVASEP